MNIKHIRKLFGFGKDRDSFHGIGKQATQHLFVMPSTPEARLEALVEKWQNLCEGFHAVRSVVENRSAPVETWYGQMPPKHVIKGLLPDTLVTYFLTEDINARFACGVFSSYDREKREVEVVHGDDILMTLGYALWHTMIGPRQLEGLAFSGPESLQSDYTCIIGAYSEKHLAQQPEPVHTDIDRRNTTEEHFGRNFDRLLRGKVISILPSQSTSLDDMLRLYKSYEIIDNQFERFYRASVDQRTRSWPHWVRRRAMVEESASSMPFRYEDPITTAEIQEILALKALV